jgi:rfaE bifunctional protein nucleotidyltransferase chain/domain
MRPPQDKIVAREVLGARLAADPPPGPVVLANGLFDLVHVGHARYLADARSRGAFLVVALNDDASAAANKGPSRPLLPLAERMEVVAAFASVDAVTWFPERTVAPTLRLVRPRYHAKGTDYRPATLPADEQAAHAELGIEVVIVGDFKSHATSDIVAEVLKRWPR